IQKRARDGERPDQRTIQVEWAFVSGVGFVERFSGQRHRNVQKAFADTNEKSGLRGRRSARGGGFDCNRLDPVLAVRFGKAGGRGQGSASSHARGRADIASGRAYRESRCRGEQRLRSNKRLCRNAAVALAPAVGPPGEKTRRYTA